MAWRGCFHWVTTGTVGAGASVGVGVGLAVQTTLVVALAALLALPLHGVRVKRNEDDKRKGV